jgi:hypothetical protein
VIAHEERKTMKKLLGWIGCLAFPVLMGGMGACTVESGGTVGPAPGPTSTTGALTVRWSIDGSFDPNLCDVYTAPTMDVRVLSQSTGQLFEQNADCHSFSTTITLPADNYTANATLLDPGGHARTTTVDLSAFTVGSGADIVEYADFPRSSFF